jgi:hypothetical protein
METKKRGWSRRIIAAFFAALALAALAAGNARAQDMGAFDMNQFSQFLQYLPPIIKTVTQEPDTPKQGDAVKVTAKVDRIHFGVDDIESVDSVKLYYTYDGEKWETADMEQGDDKVSWTCEIPAPADCTEVDYHITAVDSAGNIAMELPQWVAMPGWTPPKEGETPANSPLDFLTKIYDHKNSEKSGIPEEYVMTEIPPYMDIQTVWFGYDDNNLYFRIQFGAKPQPGTLSPVDANLYILMIINSSLDYIFNETVMAGFKTGLKNFNVNDPALKEMVKYLWAWYYSPLLDIIPPLPSIGKIPGVGLLHLNPAQIKIPVFEIKGFKYKVDGSIMDVTLDRKFIGPSEQNVFTFFAGDLNAAGTDMTSIKPKIGDLSYTTTIIMGDHAYDSCGRPLE